MNREQIVEKLTPIVREVFDDAAMEVKEDMCAENVESWTSLTFMQLLSKIEEQFSFKFKIVELINVHNMGDLLSAIEKRCV